MDDWQHRQFDPPGGGTDPGYWQIHLSLTPEDAQAVRRFGPQIVPAENFEIHTELESGGEGELIFAIRVHADTAEDAIGQAAWQLNKIRREASLERGPALALGYISPQWQRSPASQMGKEAIALLKQGRDALAILRAQTACELLITEAVQSFLRGDHPLVSTGKLLRRPVTLADRGSLEILTLLTGKRIQDATWWPQYVEHRKRRNAIAHEGVEVTHEDAQASIKAMNHLHEWLLDAREANE
jgi:HEPN domain-containing protein